MSKSTCVLSQWDSMEWRDNEHFFLFFFSFICFFLLAALWPVRFVHLWVANWENSIGQKDHRIYYGQFKTSHTNSFFSRFLFSITTFFEVLGVWCVKVKIQTTGHQRSTNHPAKKIYKWESEIMKKKITKRCFSSPSPSSEKQQMI